MKALEYSATVYECGKCLVQSRAALDSIIAEAISECSRQCARPLTHSDNGRRPWGLGCALGDTKRTNFTASFSCAISN